MISVSEAQEIIRAHCTPLPAESVSVADALGRVLADDLLSPVDLPSFDNSAMDGFALHCSGSQIGEGANFNVRGEQAAGDGLSRADGAEAWEIMTGARIPDGLDTVVPVEHAEVVLRRPDGRPARIRLATSVPAGQHVRRAGEDIRRGALAMRAGSRLQAAHLMLLAGLGIAQVAVALRPKVALLCTGRELVDDPAQALRCGQIRNSNGPFLAARVDAAGAQLAHHETVPDDAAEFAAALGRALQAGAGIILSTGAVSMGRYDFVPSALQALGAEVLFHKVAMRPGKPLLFARLAGGQLYFGLPGNPGSSAVGLRFFVEAALRRQLGLPDEQPWRLPLAHDARGKPGVRLLQKAALRLTPDGLLQVSLVHGQESFKTLSLLSANAWATLPEGDALWSAGTAVEVFPLGHESSALLGDQLS
ncbi:MAG: gephyrin-like molybdotransferase Glp [Arenimonas sp.]